MSWVKRVKNWCPPALYGPVKGITGRAVRYSGGYQSWTEALQDAAGYDSGPILSRVVAATRRVLAGDAAFERDSVLFDKLECPFHMLVAMLKATIEDGGRLSVLDFGGALGSTYRLCRPFLGTVPVQWSIVEQSAFVAAGKAEFGTSELHFYEAPEQMPAPVQPNVVLFSSSLQYLEQPYESLASATRGAIRYLIIDRTPFAPGTADHLCVQRVPRTIYPGSYPMWVFGDERFTQVLSDRWSTMAEFVAPEGQAVSSRGLSFEFRSLILARK